MEWGSLYLSFAAIQSSWLQERLPKRLPLEAARKNFHFNNVITISRHEGSVLGCGLGLRQLVCGLCMIQPHDC
jgi:hypothetical protein